MKKYLNIIFNNLKSIFSIKTLGVMTIIFIYAFLIKSSIYHSDYSFSKIIESVFAGPVTLDNILELFTWTFYQAFIIYIIGNYIFNEFSIRSIYIIPRLGSKKYWNIYIQSTCFFACIIYFVFGALIGFIASLILNTNLNIGSLNEVLKNIFLLVLSSYYMVTVYILNILIIKSHIKSFLALIILLYTSIFIGDTFNIDKYIPFNQGILMNHTLNEFSYTWSFVFLGILIIINLFIINRCLIKNDLLDVTE